MPAPEEFLDTNIIIRYLTQDNPDQSRRAYNLLQQVETGALVVTTSEAVLVEVVYVLSSKTLYNFPRPDIQAHLSTVITLRGLKLPHKRTYLRALDIYASTNLDFVDALNVAHMERVQITTILTFDKDFDKVQDVTRREP
jgi:predicted nucleic acid-binding protein